MLSDQAGILRGPPSRTSVPVTAHPSWGVCECGPALLATAGPAPPRHCQSPGTPAMPHGRGTGQPCLSRGSSALRPGPLPSRPAAAPGQGHWLSAPRGHCLGHGLLLAEALASRSFICFSFKMLPQPCFSKSVLMSEAGQHFCNPSLRYLLSLCFCLEGWGWGANIGEKGTCPTPGKDGHAHLSEESSGLINDQIKTVCSL